MSFLSLPTLRVDCSTSRVTSMEPTSWRRSLRHCTDLHQWLLVAVPITCSVGARCRSPESLHPCCFMFRRCFTRDFVMHAFSFKQDVFFACLNYLQLNPWLWRRTRGTFCGTVVSGAEQRPWRGVTLHSTSTYHVHAT